MKVESTRVGDKQVSVTIEGRVDTNSAGEFQSELMNLANEPGLDITIDCAQLSYTSSQGLRAFLMLQKALNSNGSKMVLVNLQPQVKEVFDITGFSNIIAIK